MLQLNEFDSGVLAERVGLVDASALAQSSSLQATLEAALLQGSAEKYDLVSAALSHAIHVDGWNHMGTIIRLEGRFAEVLENASRFVGRCGVREIIPSDRDDIADFLFANIAENRFLKDPNISRERAVIQKMKIFDKYIRDGAVGFLKRSDEVISGLFLSYIDDHGDIVMYEIEIEPSSRTGLRAGFLAMDLVGSTLCVLKDKAPNAQKISAQFYEDNTHSIGTFSKLGLKQVGEKKYYYHCWPKILIDGS